LQFIDKTGNGLTAPTTSFCGYRHSAYSFEEKEEED
jgi:hypothetical protein